jgi:hypothetical protein
VRSRARPHDLRRGRRVVWLLPAAVFLVALLATASLGAGGPPPSRPAVIPAETPEPSRGRSAAPPTPLLADVPELPAPLASPATRPRPRVVLAQRPATRRAAAPTAVPRPAPEVPATSAPSPRAAPAPQAVTPAPTPQPVAPAPEFDDSGSGPAFDEDGVSP